MRAFEAGPVVDLRCDRVLYRGAEKSKRNVRQRSNHSGLPQLLSRRGYLAIQLSLPDRLDHVRAHGAVVETRRRRYVLAAVLKPNPGRCRAPARAVDLRPD